MSKRITVPLALGGQYSVGNAASIPDGYVRALNNHLTRSGRLPARAPFVYDGLMHINGLVNFDDTTNRVVRLLAINTSQQVFEKATSGEAWSGAKAVTVNGLYLNDFANYRGTTYMVLEHSPDELPASASFDGTSVVSPAFSSVVTVGGLGGTAITTFDERLYIVGSLIEIAPFVGSGLPNAVYDWSTGDYTPTNVNASYVTISPGITVGRLAPTSMAASACSIYNSAFGGLFIGAPLATKQNFVWRSDLRGTDPLFNTPVTLELILTGPASKRSTAYTVGNIVVNTATGLVYRCTTAGSTAAGAVVYTTVVGALQVDGTATFICESSNILSALETTIPNRSSQPDFAPYYLAASIEPATNDPAFAGGIVLSQRLKFYNSATTALTTLADIEISLRDANTGKCFGQQVTWGSYYLPFFEADALAGVGAFTILKSSDIIWSEIGDPQNFRAANTYKLREAVGYPTAATALGGRLIVAKRNAIWQFQDTGDPDIPIRREKFISGVGVIGPRAHDKFEDTWFFIGENDIYTYSIGTSFNFGALDAKAITGDGMRETIMAKGANWVENQSTYKRPLLAIDQQQLIVWVYTQKGKLFAYDLRSERWSTHYVSNGAEVDAMIWNPNTGNFYVSFGGYGLTRMDYAAAASDTIDNTATPLALDKSFVLPPLKISTQRFDAYCEGIKLLYATANPALQSVTASISYDQGATYPNSVNYTPFLSSTSGDFVPITLDICESGPSITLKVAALGPGGEGSWSLAEQMEMKLKINRGEFPQTNPTASSSNL